jgi:phenylacetate-CoA ligase
VNVFPSAVRDMINSFGAALSGTIAIRPKRRGFRQDPPLEIRVELAEGETGGEALAQALEQRIRDTLLVTTRVVLVPYGSLPRSDYKSKLVDWSEARDS